MLNYKNSIITITVIMLSILFLFSTISAGETQPDDIIGVWLIEEDGEPVENIEIYKYDDMYFGKIIWLKQSDTTDNPAVDKKDKNNKNKELRNRPLLGLEVLMDYNFDGEDTWKGGEFYAHRKGRTVSPKLTLIDEHHLKIQVKILFVKKSFIWKRVASN